MQVGDDRTESPIASGERNTHERTNEGEKKQYSGRQTICS